MRLKDRIAIVVGAGQSPGEGIGNGRATALTFAREGAKVLCVDHNLTSAQDTVDMIAANGGTAVAFKADVTRHAEIEAMVADVQARWGRIDILHNNVASAWPAVTPNCSTSPRRRSTAVWRSTSRAAFSQPSM
jgi:NAD(P)-dependent dehydrogenase (short-subunit alcohol dehydrogenase family)